MKLPGTISIDVDTIQSIFKTNCSGGEFEDGLSNICDFFGKYGIKTTLFFVGRDIAATNNRAIIKNIISSGHEIANHTMNHVQGLRFLPKEEKEREIVEFETVCEKATGCKPVGFRAPGWNIDEDILEILVERGYKYDSSIFPTFLMPLMKSAYYMVKRAGNRSERSTMGRLNYMFCPTEPYRTGSSSFNKGSAGLLEFPITVSPVMRIPLFATMLLRSGVNNFKRALSSVLKKRSSVQFMLHLSDFVDYSRCRDIYFAGIKHHYIPDSLLMDYNKKIDMIRSAIDMIGCHCDLKTYKERCA